MKTALILALMILSTQAQACPNFSGVWVGGCSAENPTNKVITISQGECRVLGIQYVSIPEEGYYFSGLQFNVGAANAQAMDYSGKDGKPNRITQATTAQWNSDQTELHATQVFQHETEGQRDFEFGHTIKFSIVNGKLIKVGTALSGTASDYNCEYQKRD